MKGKSESEKEFSRIIAMCWCIWSGRIEALFKIVNLYPEGVMQALKKALVRDLEYISLKEVSVYQKVLKLNEKNLHVKLE